MSTCSECERLRREVEEARQVADDRLSDNARLTNEKADALFALAEARKGAFIEAAEIAEGPLYKEHYRGDENGNWTSYSDYGRGRFDAADAIRAKAEETKP